MDFKEVYDAHFAFVWRSLRRLRVADANLKDAMQDVFLVVHRRLGEFEGRAKVSTWLFGICWRVAKDYRRRAHVKREVLDDSGFASVADPNVDAAASAERNEELVRFEAALDELDLDQRAVFMLFELENLTRSRSRWVRFTRGCAWRASLSRRPRWRKPGVRPKRAREPHHERTAPSPR